MIYDDNGSVEGPTGWYLVVLGQCRALRGSYMMLLGQYEAELVDT